jgi:hypothetical protein
MLRTPGAFTHVAFFLGLGDQRQIQGRFSSWS